MHPNTSTSNDPQHYFDSHDEDNPQRYDVLDEEEEEEELEHQEGIVYSEDGKSLNAWL